MLDITTIQTFAVAPALKTLMENNKEITTMNTNLKTGIIVLVIVSGITVLYLMKINKELKQNFNKQIKI
jgi:hypothetical protein